MHFWLKAALIILNFGLYEFFCPALENLDNPEFKVYLVYEIAINFSKYKQS